MEDRGWRMENGGWRMEDGELRIVSKLLLKRITFRDFPD
jgi:hypothetical protein